MEKNDLKAGVHGVVTRDGKRYIVAYNSYGKSCFLLGSDGYTGLDGFMDNLRHFDHSNLDIVKVFTLRESSMKYQRIDEDTVWQEDEEQSCRSLISDAESKIALHEAKIEDLSEDILKLKSRLQKISETE